MQYITVIFTALLALFYLFKTKRLYNSMTIFMGFWMLIIVLSSLQLDGMKEVKQRTYAYIFIGLASFALGSIISEFLVRHKKEKTEFNFELPKYVYGFLYIAIGIIILYSIYRMTLIFKFYQEGNTWREIRNMHGIAGEGGQGSLRGGNYSIMIHDLIVAPLVYMVLPAAVIEFFVGKRNKWLIGLSVLAILFYSLGSVSRAVWVFAILYIGIIMVIFYFNKSIPKSSTKVLRAIPIILLVLILIVFGITMMRSGDSSVNLKYNALAYLTGGVSLFDMHLDGFASTIRTYGVFSLYGFLYPVFFVLHYLGIMRYPLLVDRVQYIKLYLEEFHKLSDHITMNAYSTMFFNFYSDFGVIGIILGSAIFGIAAMYAYQNFIKNQDFRTLLIYLIVVQFMLFSMARIYTSLTTRALSFIWILFIFPKNGGIIEKVELYMLNILAKIFGVFNIKRKKEIGER